MEAMLDQATENRKTPADASRQQVLWPACAFFESNVRWLAPLGKQYHSVVVAFTRSGCGEGLLCFETKTPHLTRHIRPVSRAQIRSRLKFVDEIRRGAPLDHHSASVDSNRKNTRQPQRQRGRTTGRLPHEIRYDHRIGPLLRRLNPTKTQR